MKSCLYSRLYSIQSRVVQLPPLVGDWFTMGFYPTNAARAIPLAEQNLECAAMHSCKSWIAWVCTPVFFSCSLQLFTPKTLESPWLISVSLSLKKGQPDLFWLNHKHQKRALENPQQEDTALGSLHHPHCWSSDVTLEKEKTNVDHANLLHPTLKTQKIATLRYASAMVSVAGPPLAPAYRYRQETTFVIEYPYHYCLWLRGTSIPARKRWRAKN
ncbi:uncharacterized protein PGTG_05588 [Puccinia graminis f. sp. tritici CRL 75-36-700-3]|uniref:Uncharacterized protein n=1 Tax=Puccinia graminis f. sp. tritici (strain CRL 75-36-700-3 / race SCCL) TaxID=418459 RepID=E3K4V2_PUCGT|nr:uncharacterized protein PGTG_05588 [Puccinia graminis f. sp. tritici CRL 75-36-700-3]EFP79267.1 hypothetical protein PGTG_05588 [Puccinia graminis f. sp. tritici CRL 75-36-700-3]